MWSAGTCVASLALAASCLGAWDEQVHMWARV